MFRAYKYKNGCFWAICILDFANIQQNWKKVLLEVLENKLLIFKTILFGSNKTGFLEIGCKLLISLEKTLDFQQVQQ